MSGTDVNLKYEHWQMPLIGAVSRYALGAGAAFLW
jgi:hypothetical protein